MSWNQVFQSNPLRQLAQSELELLCTAIRLTAHRYSGRGELFRKLGTTYRGKKIPPDFAVQAVVEGVNFIVYPSESFALRAQGKRSWGTSAGMRAYVNCPICRKEISIGRMGQHAEVHVPRKFIGDCQHQAWEQAWERKQAGY